MLIVNFPFLCGNVPAAPANEVNLSKLIRYSITYISYPEFHDIECMPIEKLPKGNHGFTVARFKSSLRKFYGRHHDLIDVTKYL